VIVSFQKKPWVKPEVSQWELLEARGLIISALQKIEGDNELQAECAELRLVIDAIDGELRSGETPPDRPISHPHLTSIKDSAPGAD
jgi:hypothetical protein